MANHRFRRPEARDWIRTALLLAAVCALIVAFAIWLGEPYPMLAAALIAAVVGMLLGWHAATTAYRCPDCGHEFAISAWADLLSPNMLTTKYVKCPRCGRRAWMEALVKDRPATLCRARRGGRGT